VISEHAVLDQPELSKMGQAVAALGESKVRLLINRLNEYGPPASFNVTDFVEAQNFQITRVAYYAPTPGDQTMSHLVGQTAFRKTTYQVFTDREKATSWLLSDDT